MVWHSPPPRYTGQLFVVLVFFCPPVTPAYVTTAAQRPHFTPAQVSWLVWFPIPWNRYHAHRSRFLHNQRLERKREGAWAGRCGGAKVCSYFVTVATGSIAYRCIRTESSREYSRLFHFCPPCAIKEAKFKFVYMTHAHAHTLLNYFFS